MSRLIRCIVVDDEPIAREILENHLKKIERLKVVASCKNALEAFKAINTGSVDLIFLDINLPEISGLSFAKSVTKDIKIIFTTAYREYAVEGFDLQAVDYLLKPISYDRLLQAVNKYLNEAEPQVASMEEIQPEKSDCIFVRSDRKMSKINFSEIRYVESIADYVKFHLTDKTVMTRETISNIEAKLPQDEFIRVHRSFIIALTGFESYTSEFVEIDGHQIPISRSYKTAFLERLES